jgi:hypothetical protein
MDDGRARCSAKHSVSTPCPSPRRLTIARALQEEGGATPESASPRQNHGRAARDRDTSLPAGAGTTSLVFVRYRCHPLTGGVAGAFTATEQLKRPIIQYTCALPALCLARADAGTLMCRLELPRTD